MRSRSAVYQPSSRLSVNRLSVRPSTSFCLSVHQPSVCPSTIHLSTVRPSVCQPSNCPTVQLSVRQPKLFSKSKNKIPGTTKSRSAGMSSPPNSDAAALSTAQTQALLLNLTAEIITLVSSQTPAIPVTDHYASNDPFDLTTHAGDRAF